MLKRSTEKNISRAFVIDSHSRQRNWLSPPRAILFKVQATMSHLGSSSTKTPVYISIHPLEKLRYIHTYIAHRRHRQWVIKTCYLCPASPLVIKLVKSDFRRSSRNFQSVTPSELRACSSNFSCSFAQWTSSGSPALISCPQNRRKAIFVFVSSCDVKPYSSTASLTL